MSITGNLQLIRLGEAISKRLSSIMFRSTLREFVNVIELYGAFLAGRGSGQSWNMESEVKCASRYIHGKNPVVFDVGANKGEWAEIMARDLPQVRLYLFEPQLSCHEILRSRNIPNSIIVPKGLSSREGKADFFTSGTVTNEASLHERRDSIFQGSTYEVVKIEITSVDLYMEKEGIDFIDFLKMDVEGHEYQVLVGADKALSEGRIGALSFEFGSSNINSRIFFHDFWDLLTGYGYKIGRILPSGSLYPIESYSEECEYFRGVSNYIAHR